MLIVGQIMSSVYKKLPYLIMLLFIFPASANAEIKIYIGAPAYKYKHNYSNHYSNRHNYRKNIHSKNNKFNKYNFPPYSYGNTIDTRRANKSYYYSPSYRYQANRYNNNGYYNYNNKYRRNRSYQKGYRHGLKDARRLSKKRHYKLGD